MLELYHWEPNGAGARVLICLKEKGVEFTSRYVDLLAFEQHEPDFLKLNDTGEVPVLVRDGETSTEASYICEYLDEAFPDPALMPREPHARWAVRAWQKYVDDYVAASASELAWHAYGEPAVKARDRSALDEAVARIPSRERRDLWATAVAGYRDDQLAASRGRLADAVAKIETDAELTGWLAGPAYSLADIAAFAYVNYLPRLMPEALAEAPHTVAWLNRVAARPAVQAALALARTPDPYAVAAPGPEQVRWG